MAVLSLFCRSYHLNQDIKMLGGKAASESDLEDERRMAQMAVYQSLASTYCTLQYVIVVKSRNCNELLLLIASTARYKSVDMPNPNARLVVAFATFCAVLRIIPLAIDVASSFRAQENLLIKLCVYVLVILDDCTFNVLCPSSEMLRTRLTADVLVSSF